MNVLVTRPDERGEKLVEWLAERQIFAIHQPILKIEAGKELPLLPSILSRLNAGDFVFAVSKNAVDFSVKALKETGFKWRNDLLYLAVGQGTAGYFCSQVEQAVSYPIESENSEGLLNLKELQELDGKQIVILRAHSGREYFSDQARSRGAIVEPVECYQRLLWAENLPEKLSLAKRAGIDTLVVTSGEILKTLIEQTQLEDLPWLFSCRIIVVGKRMAEIAQESGWPTEFIMISEKADNQSLQETLLSNVKS